MRRTATASGAEGGATDPSIYRRKSKSPLTKVQQAFRRGGFKSDVDMVDGRSKSMVVKRESTPVFDEVFNYLVHLDDPQVVRKGRVHFEAGCCTRQPNQI